MSPQGFQVLPSLCGHFVPIMWGFFFIINPILLNGNVCDAFSLIEVIHSKSVWMLYTIHMMKYEQYHKDILKDTAFQKDGFSVAELLSIMSCLKFF